MKTHSYSYSVEIDSQISVHVALAILYYACVEEAKGRHWPPVFPPGSATDPEASVT